MFEELLVELGVEKKLLMEATINAVGYLAAGGLSVLLYSSITKRRWRKMFAEIVEQNAEVVAASINSSIERNQMPTNALPADAIADTRTRNIAENESSSEFVTFDLSQVRGVDRTNSADRSDRTDSGDRIGSAVTEYRKAQSAMTDNSASGTYTRNRTDVIRLAKEMLASGRTSDTVRSSLPITESEMKLVELGARS